MDWLYRLSDRLNTYYRATDIPVCILGTDGTLMNSIGHENRSAASKTLCERDCPCAEIRARRWGRSPSRSRSRSAWPCSAP